ncbi:MAG: hypothetical protein ABIH46_12245 [Chloroflexota bacterium]
MMDIEKARLTKREAYDLVAYLFDEYDWDGIRVVANAASLKMLKYCIARLREKAGIEEAREAYAYTALAEDWQQTVKAWEDPDAEREG